MPNSPPPPLRLEHPITFTEPFLDWLLDLWVPMKDKFLQYWCDIPMLYYFAFILEPRAKLKGFTNVLRVLSQLNGND